MKLLRLLFIALVVLLLAGCFPDPTVVPTPTQEFWTPTPFVVTATPLVVTPTPDVFTPEPPISGNLLRNGDLVYVPGYELGECPGTLCVVLPYWWALNYAKPRGAIERWPDVALPLTDAFFAEDKSSGNTPSPWNGFIIPAFGNVSQEVKVESSIAVCALQNQGPLVHIGQEYYFYAHITPLILAEEPAAEWLPDGEMLYSYAVARGQVPPLPFVRQSAHGRNWYDTAIWRLLILPIAGGVPYYVGPWLDGYDVQAQTGNEGYTVGFGDFVTIDGYWTPDETHCTEGPTCQVTLVLEMAVRDVNGVVPYLGSMYVHAAYFGIASS